MKVVAMVGALLLIGGASVLSQEKTPQQPKPQQEHGWLKQFEGEWEYRGKWMTPGEQAQETTGTESSRMAFGGFWLICEFTGEYDRKPFKGHSMVGYDPDKRKFISACIGDNAPHLTQFEGEADAAGKTFTFKGECMDPKTGKMAPHRVVMNWTDKDHRTDRMYKIDSETGKETLVGEFTYTRKGKTEAK